MKTTRRDHSDISVYRDKLADKENPSPPSGLQR
jgi:hypothetical protein